MKLVYTLLGVPIKWAENEVVHGPKMKLLPGEKRYANKRKEDSAKKVYRIWLYVYDETTYTRVLKKIAQPINFK